MQDILTNSFIHPSPQQEVQKMKAVEELRPVNSKQNVLKHNKHFQILLLDVKSVSPLLFISLT